MNAPTQTNMEALAAPHGAGFSAQQKTALAAPLNADNVKERDQAGRTLSYLEGWKAVEEANRIFGFDGWDRQTVDLKLVAEHPRKIGRAPNQRDGFGVSYIAKVQVVVRAGATYVTREGTGVGHGIDADCGLAHESAIKEAETDAMKRALMTFGNQFGLALYDKAKTNVVQLPKKNSRDLYARMQEEIDGIEAADELLQWGSEATERISVLPADWVQILRSRFAEKLAALRQHRVTEVVWEEDAERPAIAHPTPPPQRARPKTIVPAPKRSLNSGIAKRALTARSEAAHRPHVPTQPFTVSGPPFIGSEAGKRLHPMNDELPEHSAPPKPDPDIPEFLDRSRNREASFLDMVRKV
jgi:DNA recombination protein Rad52